MARVLLFCVIEVLVLSTMVNSIAILQIQLIEYDNSKERDWEDRCCDQSCWRQCDHYFIFCIDKYEGDNNMGSCQYYRAVTGHYNDKNVLVFSGGSIKGVPNPIKKNFLEGWPGGYKFKVQVNDKDDLNRDDLVDYLHIDIEATPSRGESEAAWSPQIQMEGKRSKNKSKLIFRYMVYCEKDYYDTKCSTYCKARDDKNGHYRCDPATGNKVCLTGWEDPKRNCLVEIDDCDGVNCQNGGECVDGKNSYTCRCVDGFRGQHCEENIDDCEGNPCQNGGTCFDGVNTFTCECPSGFVGPSCADHVCNSTSPCNNGGTCYDDGKCHCTLGFVGPTCDIHRCTVIHCHNGGLCQDNGTCSCPPGYLDALCSVHACEVLQCDNGGSCADGKCVCPPDFTGTHCSQTIDDCVGDPCMNDAVCIDGIASFSCSCLPGYNGSMCEMHFQPLWMEEEFPNITEKFYDVPTQKGKLAEWIIILVVILILVVAVAVGLVYMYRRKFLRAKKNNPDLGNFENPTYNAGQVNPAFSVTSMVSLSPTTPSDVTSDYMDPSISTRGALQATENVYDNPELLKRQISSDYSELPAPPLPERNLSTASDPFSEYAAPVSPPRPVLPDLVEDQDQKDHRDQISPIVSQQWPVEDDQAGELPTKQAI